VGPAGKSSHRAAVNAELGRVVIAHVRAALYDPDASALSRWFYVSTATLG